MSRFYVGRHPKSVSGCRHGGLVTGMRKKKKGALFAAAGFAAEGLAAVVCLWLMGFSFLTANLIAQIALVTGLAVGSFAIVAGAVGINAGDQARLGLPDAQALNILGLIDEHNNLDTLEDCRATLEWLVTDKNSLEAFTGDFVLLIDQIDSFVRKKKAVVGMLREHFSETEMTYGQFKATFDDAEAVFLRNIKSVLIRLNAFDEADFRRLREGGDRFAAEIAAEKRKIFDEYFEYNKSVIRHNDTFLIKMDAFLSEISKLSSWESGDASSIEAMKDLEALVSNVKKYKQG
jgi:hypothetical protein